MSSQVVSVVSVPVVPVVSVVQEMKEVVSGLNINLMMNKKLSEGLSKAMSEVVEASIRMCASRYGFVAEEALEMLSVQSVQKSVQNVLKPENMKSQKAAPKAKESKPKSSFPLPYNGEMDENLCYALRQNSGLYTQCQGVRNENGKYCKKCELSLQKSCSEVPEFGTIEQRKAVGIFEYVDPKGRKPIAYTKIMKKYNLTEEKVQEEASKFSMKINPEHFEMATQEAKRGRPSMNKEPKVKGVKGRPKKSEKVLEIDGEDEETDLVAMLVAKANAEMVSDNVSDMVSDNEEAKEEENTKKEEEKAKKAAEKEAKKAAEKAEKEAKLAAEKAEKEAKKAAEKAEKEAKLAAEKAEKDAKKAEKEAKKAAKEPKKESKKEAKKVEEEEEGDKVKKITFENKHYLKSLKTGIVYDYDEYVNNDQNQVVVGKWDETTKRVILTKASEESDEESDGEESEEEYED